MRKINKKKREDWKKDMSKKLESNIASYVSAGGEIEKLDSIKPIKEIIIGERPLRFRDFKRVSRRRFWS